MGPTASGKSALALALARRLGGEIVNADSMQVYRDLRVLTARPTPVEEAEVPHHLYGHVDAAERYSVGRWLADAIPAIGAIKTRGKTPIVVGGTGLYFKALTEGLAEIPAPPPEIRERLRLLLNRDGAPAMHAALARVDPGSASRLSPHDAPRILRALEVWETTGAPMSEFHASTSPALPPPAWAGVALTPGRERLYQAINARFELMLQHGALNELRALAARELDPSLPAMKAHGAPALMAHLRGELTLPAAAEIARRDTRRYAKRQFTWIAHQLKDWPTIAAEDIETRIAGALTLLDRRT